MSWLKKITLVAMWFSSCASYGQDFVFVKYQETNEETPKFRSFKSDDPKLKEFQAQYNMQRIDVLADKRNEINLETDCFNLQRLGIFINRNVLTGQVACVWNESSKNWAEQETSNGILFLNLTQIFNEFFPSSLQNTESWFDKDTDVNAPLQRICDLALLESGVQVKIGTEVIFKIRNKASKIIADFTDIEPRQYVTIYEKKNPSAARKGLINTANEVKPIWWLEKRKDDLVKEKRDNSLNVSYQFYPNQPYRVISNQSVLEIRFDNEALARNIDFHGSVSLIAKSGERKIEVSPYSVIGEGQKEFGVDAMPIKEIADYLFRLMIEAIRLNSQLQDVAGAKLKFDSNTTEANAFLTQRKIELGNTLEQAISALGSKISDDPDKLKSAVSGFDLNDPLVLILQKLANFFPNDGELLLFLNQMIVTDPLAVSTSPLTYQKLKEYHDKISKTDANTKKRSVLAAGEKTIEAMTPRDISNSWTEKLGTPISTAKLCFELMKRIKMSNDQTISAFLSVTTLTITDFNDMYNEAERIYKILNVEITDKNPNDLIKALSEYQNIFNRFKGSSILFNDLIRRIGYDLNSQNTRTEEIINKLLSSKDVYNSIRDEFAMAAGREIFKKMVYATINLSKANLADGSELVIGLVWYNAEGSYEMENVNKKNGTELWTASFIVKKTGWYLEVTESALLIHRIDEEKLRSGYPLSPSNFKPTAGANLLWSYYNPHRTVTRIKSKGDYKGQYKEYGFLKFLHWLEPSFGINVSYLDFRTDRDFEFGAGPVMGLFQNRIFLTSGYNLNVNGESPFYMGLGFSFSNIYKRINKADN